MSAVAVAEAVHALPIVGSTPMGPALSTLSIAFATDPPSRWLFPEPEAYLAGFPHFVRGLGGAAFAGGAADSTADGRATALWLAPGQSPDEEAIVESVEEFAPPDLHAEAFAVFEAMGRTHPTEPHWYLPFIGVDPSAQGQGLGSSLLAHGLARCDQDRVPAYLEATSERSVPLYRRHGFEVVTVIRIGSCPPITPMWREARTR
jgi:ribosomal protein S18 acetylase RimI-like enzyme